MERDAAAVRSRPMDELSMSPSRRLDGRRAYGRATDAFETVAWKAPTAARFRNQVANDAPVAPMPDRPPNPSLGETMRSLPNWVVVVAGGVIAALMGALLGAVLGV